MSDPITVKSYGVPVDPWQPNEDQWQIVAGDVGFGCNATANDITFLAGGVEVMRFSGSGTITVRGEIVDDNVAVYRAFVEWLGKARGMDNPGA